MRKGKKIIKDEETIDEAFVIAGNTLLLIDKRPSEYDPYKMVQEDPATLSTKMRGPPNVSKTMVLDPEEDKEKEKEKNWWEKGVGSGPKSAKSSFAKESKEVESVPQQPETKETQPNPIDPKEQEEMRRKRLEAIQARYGK